MFNTIYKYMGLRASEVGLLKIDDVDLYRRRIRIYRLKGGVSGECGIFSDTARLRKAYLHTSPTLFSPCILQYKFVYFMYNRKNPDCNARLPPTETENRSID